MSLKSKFEIVLLVCLNLIASVLSVSFANVLTFIIVYVTLFITIIIVSRDLFKAIDYTQTDEQILVEHGNKLIESGRVTMFIALLTTLDVLLLLFMLPQSFPGSDPAFSQFPGLHLLLFLFTFVFPYAVHQVRGEKLEKIFIELLFIDFSEKLRNIPLEEQPEFLRGPDTNLNLEGTNDKSTNSALTPERYNELLLERDEFFGKYYPSLKSLFQGKNMALNSYYLSEVLKKRVQSITRN
ncbi:MAG: hypothetical protein ACTSRU_00320 [Candidatus Hodarchaeales archaeon]